MTTPQRPATARPRDEAVGPTEMAPPTAAELEAIERQLAALSRPPDAPAQPTDAVRWPLERVPAMLDEHERQSRDDGRWPSLVVSEGLTQPPDLAELLIESGWQSAAREQVLVTRHPPEVPHLEPDLRVEAVTRATSAECVDIETQVFGLDEQRSAERAQQLAVAIEAGRLRGFLVRHRGHTVASTRLLVAGPSENDRVAGLHGIGVAEPYRRRGYGRLVTAVASRAGLASGHRVVWLSVEPDNSVAVGLYLSLGYVPAFAWTRWLAPAPVD